MGARLAKGTPPVTMRSGPRDRGETGTLLEGVLQLHGAFRRSLEPLRITPLQAGAILYLHRHGAAKLKDVAAALSVMPATASQVMKDLVSKRWVTNQRVPHDDRALCLQLSWQGEALVGKIKNRVRSMSRPNHFLTTTMEKQV